MYRKTILKSQPNTNLSLAIKEPLAEMLGVFLWTKFLNSEGVYTMTMYYDDLRPKMPQEFQHGELASLLGEYGL